MKNVDFRVASYERCIDLSDLTKVPPNLFKDDILVSKKKKTQLIFLVLIQQNVHVLNKLNVNPLNIMKFPAMNKILL